MKPMKKLLILLFTFSISSVWSQKADKIVQNYLQKLGGKKLEQVHSILQKGTMTMNGMDFPMENYQDTSGKMYSKINMMGQEIVAFAFDGQKGYQFNNFNYEDIPDSLANKYREKAKNLFGHFYKYKERGGHLKYLGKQKFDGIDAESIQISFDKPIEGDVKTLVAYFNPETGLLLGIKTEKDNHIVIVRPTDYKEFDGILFPVKTTVELDGNLFQTIKLDSIQINPPTPDPKIFEKPKK